MRKLYFLKTTILVSVFLFSTPLISQPIIQTSPVISGLSAPIQIVNAGDGTNRLFVVQQGGTILVYEEDYDPLGTFLTVTGINTGGEEGLLSMVFHPEYENAASPFFGFFYVYYTNSSGNLELARYEVSSDPNVADVSTRETVLTIPHPGQSNHNGATLHFGNDGYLYFATGDGGGSGDAPNNAQNGEVLLGKMLRINVNSSEDAPFYSIPPDNPYVGSPTILPEIYSFGLRNPFRWSFDRLTGDMWIGDVGQGNWEEVNFVAAGSTSAANYGWRCYEGEAPFNTTGCGPASSYVAPVFVYPNPVSGASAVTGGTVYRGPIAEMQGYYISSDFYSGNFYLIAPDGIGGFETTTQAAVMENVANFGEAENGDLFAVNLVAGTISEISASGVLPTALLSFTATPVNASVNLAWRTSFEQDLDKFEIQYSGDGTGFAAVGTIDAENNSSGAEYNYTHVPGISGRSFYRLRMIDIDGQFEYSNVVSVINTATARNFVMPSIINSGIMNIYLPGEYTSLEVISMNGSSIYRQNISGRTGRLDVSIPSFTPFGTYVVQLTGREGIVRQRVVIE